MKSFLCNQLPIVNTQIMILAMALIEDRKSVQLLLGFMPQGPIKLNAYHLVSKIDHWDQDP